MKMKTNIWFSYKGHWVFPNIISQKKPIRATSTNVPCLIYMHVHALYLTLDQLWDTGSCKPYRGCWRTAPSIIYLLDSHSMFMPCPSWFMLCLERWGAYSIALLGIVKLTFVLWQGDWGYELEAPNIMLLFFWSSVVNELMPHTKLDVIQKI